MAAETVKEITARIHELHTAFPYLTPSYYYRRDGELTEQLKEAHKKESGVYGNHPRTGDEI